jgi:hypothetical protein
MKFLFDDAGCLGRAHQTMFDWLDGTLPRDPADRQFKRGASASDPSFPSV